MGVGLFALYAAAALGAPDADEASLATRIKRGLATGLVEQGDVDIESIRLFRTVVAMTDDELEAALTGDQPFPVGLIETRDHGRLRVSCHYDTCVGALGKTRVTVTLVDAALPPAPRRGPARPQ